MYWRGQIGGFEREEKSVSRPSVCATPKLDPFSPFLLFFPPLPLRHNLPTLEKPHTRHYKTRFCLRFTHFIGIFHTAATFICCLLISSDRKFHSITARTQEWWWWWWWLLILSPPPRAIAFSFPFFLLFFSPPSRIRNGDRFRIYIFANHPHHVIGRISRSIHDTHVAFNGNSDRVDGWMDGNGPILR